MRVQSAWAWAWAVGAAVMIGSVAFYALEVEPDWVEVTTHTVGEGRADRNSRGVRVVQISDLHLRNFAQREAELTRKIQDLRPDAIVFTGDIIDRAENLALLESFLAALGPTPRVAVLGNWEYWSTVDLQRLRSIYETTPNSFLLVNQRATLALNGREFEFVGLDDFTAGKPAAALMKRPGQDVIRVVLQHSPGFFGAQTTRVESSNQICLSGHTHGGQVTFFGRVLWTPRGSGDFVAGWYFTRDCRLYISRGVGMSILPIRFGARPEVAVFEF